MSGPRQPGGIKAVGRENVRPTFTANQLLDKADEYLSNLQYELAQKFCERAISTDKTNTRALEVMSTILLEMDDPEGAYPLLEKAVSLEPNRGFRKYMMLAMLHSGKESLAQYNKGIEVLRAEMSIAVPLTVPGDELSMSLAAAYTSIAELYMTDLCMEPTAETECKKALDHAVAADPENIEAHQTMASYYISASNIEDAKIAIRKSVSLWLKPEALHNAMADGLTEDEVMGAVDQDSLPSYEFRLNTVRILSELEMYPEAFEIMGRLEKEDDEVVEVWYMHGLVAQLTGDHATAIECLREAERVYKLTGCPDDQVFAHIQSILDAYSRDGTINADGTINVDDSGNMSE
eukprot:CFRG6478T1